MKLRHWTDLSEQQLAQLRAGHVVHASRPSRGVLPLAHAPDVTAATKAVLNGLRLDTDPGPAYPAEWLPEIKATQTPAEWMDENRPDTITQRNGTAPANTPSAEAYPAEWLQGLNTGEPPSGGLSSEGFINDRRAA